MLRRLRRLARGHTPDIEMLSTHLDRRLSAAQARHLETHLASCDVCASALTEMREARLLLAAMPDVAAPRSFRLRVADVEETGRARSATGTSLMRWAPALSGAAVMVFFVALGFSVLSTRGDTAADLASSDVPLGSVDADNGFAASRAEATDVGGTGAPPTMLGAAPPDVIAPTQVFSQSQLPTVDAGSEAAGGGEIAPADDAASAATPPAAGAVTEATAEDAPVADSGLAEDGDGGAAESFAPPPEPASTAAMGVAPGGATEYQRDGFEKVQSGDDDGNSQVLLVVQIAAAIVAVVTAVGYVAWRRTRGGVTE